MQATFKMVKHSLQELIIQLVMALLGAAIWDIIKMLFNLNQARVEYEDKKKK